MAFSKRAFRVRNPDPLPQPVTENIREAIGLHLDGEDLAALGFSANPTILATLELDVVA